MANKKTNETNIRKLTKIGKHSMGITLPIEIVREFGWRERQKLIVKKSGKKLVVEDWEK